MGKVVICQIPGAHAATTVSAPIPIYDQMITVKFGDGCESINFQLTVVGTVEHVDIPPTPVTLTDLTLEPKIGVASQFVASGNSPFSGNITGSPTATSVSYTNDTNENMFAIFFNYNGSSVWGRPVLHNLTRGNSRYITAFNTGTNTITTTSSPGDGWTVGDSITLQSQTNTQPGYFDIYLGTRIAPTDVGAYVVAAVSDVEGNYDHMRSIELHPYESYDMGKVVICQIPGSYAATTVSAPIPINDQMITVKFGDGSESINFQLTVVGTVEYVEIE